MKEKKDINILIGANIKREREKAGTHYMEEAEALSDRIAIMKDGKLLICDTADEIKKAAG